MIVCLLVVLVVLVGDGCWWMVLLRLKGNRILEEGGS